MGLVAVMTVELEASLTDPQRQAFAAGLTECEWQLVEPLSSAWCCAYEEGITEDEAAEMAMEDVADAADAADIEHFKVCLHWWEFPCNDPVSQLRLRR